MKKKDICWKCEYGMMTITDPEGEIWCKLDRWHFRVKRQCPYELEIRLLCDKDEKERNM